MTYGFRVIGNEKIELGGIFDVGIQNPGYSLDLFLQDVELVLGLFDSSERSIEGREDLIDTITMRLRNESSNVAEDSKNTGRLAAEVGLNLLIEKLLNVEIEEISVTRRKRNALNVRHVELGKEIYSKGLLCELRDHQISGFISFQVLPSLTSKY
jgi:hypothetical protein